MSFPTLSRSELRALRDALSAAESELHDVTESDAVETCVAEVDAELNARNAGVRATARHNLIVRGIRQTVLDAQAADPTLTLNDVLSVIEEVFADLADDSLQGYADGTVTE